MFGAELCSKHVPVNKPVKLPVSQVGLKSALKFEHKAVQHSLPIADRH